MPILYIHGVNTRNRSGFDRIKPYLRRLAAPAISRDPNTVLIDDAYWGDLASKFAWDGHSRPRSRLLGQGAADRTATTSDLAIAAAQESVQRRLPEAQFPATGAPTGGLISGGASEANRQGRTLRLADFQPDELSNYLAFLIRSYGQDQEQRAALAIEADALAHDPQFRAELAAAASPQREIEVFTERLQSRVAGSSNLVGMGAPAWLAGLKDRVSETLRRGADLPAYVVSIVGGELRRPLNDFVSVFLGDVLTYLNGRLEGSGPGLIPSVLLDKLRLCHANKIERNGEPLVLLSHSMGGQLVYDAVTHFLEADPALRHVRVDFWCATASQVGFFEEMKLFLASSSNYGLGKPAPFPGAHLGVWWNVWDYNDFVSYTVRDIIDKVDDGPFDSGMSLLEAHGGYLECPTFYRKLASKLESASANGWRAP